MAGDKPKTYKLGNEIDRLEKRALTFEHKASMAKGRSQSLVVRHYLEALLAAKRPGRRLTPAQIKANLEEVERDLESADTLKRLQLLERQRVLKAKLRARELGPDLSDLENQFINVAKSYGERKAISYSTWRAAGISAETLRKAKIPRTRTPR